LFLVEGKHSINSLLPSKGDIKDGLLKMILYCNLIETKVDGKDMECRPILELTSTKLKGQINSNSSEKEISDFINNNAFNEGQKQIIKKLFEETKCNNFAVNIKHESLDRL